MKRLAVLLVATVQAYIIMVFIKWDFLINHWSVIARFSFVVFIVVLVALSHFVDELKKRKK